MLAGFWSGPFTRSGKSALVPKGPWHYALSGLAVHYKASLEFLKDVVPKPLELDNGEVLAYLVDVVSWSPNAAEVNIEAPDMVQYGEAAFFLKVKHEGNTYAYCPYMWVDNDVALLRGLLAGWPKKLARLAITRLHPMLPALNRPKKGMKLGGYAMRYGYGLYSIRVELEQENPSKKLPLLGEYPFILPRYFADIAPSLGGVNELVEFVGEADIEAWEGKGGISIGGGFNDELDAFRPVGEVKGYYFNMLLKAKSLRSVAKMEGF
ncbi:MAG: acetoacetate decarboxylase family protein [Thaumarchaeota archaeon]|jgi:hypothetical protein|nr:acetoacetate decarboxylase family protein [Candidatus Terraquivivens yellowstonensis]MCL7392232.1 acetoacetate decarboxylase family protein [Candidatus Terraquivivens yellowstonensis]